MDKTGKFSYVLPKGYMFFDFLFASLRNMSLLILVSTLRLWFVFFLFFFAKVSTYYNGILMLRGLDFIHL